jgi:hypothetical protein
MDSTAESIDRRVRAVEDELAIIRLVASYGPMVDTGLNSLAPALFATDGIYDVSVGRLVGPEAIKEMLSGDDHRSVVQQGIAHVMGLPFVRLEGDSATAINTTHLYLREGNGYSIFRVAQNLWRLTRTADGWKVIERTNRLIGDDDEARTLLESALVD